MKKAILTKSLSLTLVFLFCFAAILCQNVLGASEPNETAIEASPEDSNAPDADVIKSEKSLNVSKENTLSDYDLGLQRHSLEIGSEIYSYTYKESGLEDQGIFYGGILNYTYRGWVPGSPNEPVPGSGGSFRAEFRFASGEADYDGQLMGGTPYKMDDIGFDALETRLMLGLDVIDVDWLASISTGVGYRYSNDDSSFDPAGYERASNYLYIPLAYQLDGKFENNWAWGLKLESDFLAWGQQKTYLSDVGYSDVKNQQHAGFGLRSSIKFQKKMDTGILTIEPFVRYWNIDDSEIEYVPSFGYVLEPENKTTEIGLQLMWKF